MLSFPCGCSNLPSPNQCETSGPSLRRSPRGQSLLQSSRRDGIESGCTVPCPSASPRSQGTMRVRIYLLGRKRRVRVGAEWGRRRGPRGPLSVPKVTVRLTLIRLDAPSSSYTKVAHSLHHGSLGKCPPYSPQAVNTQQQGKIILSPTAANEQTPPTHCCRHPSTRLETLLQGTCPETIQTHHTSYLNKKPLGSARPWAEGPW